MKLSITGALGALIRKAGGLGAFCSRLGVSRWTVRRWFLERPAASKVWAVNALARELGSRAVWPKKERGQ